MTPEFRDKLFNDLVIILDEELKLYDRLLELTRSKQSAIVDSRLNELRSIVSDEQTLLPKIKKISDQRLTLVNQIASHFIPAEKHPRLSSILEWTPPALTLQLENMRLQLQNKIGIITGFNRQTQYMLNFSLKHVRQLISLFLQPENSPNEIYNIQGTMKKQDRSNKLLDFQI